MRIQQELGQKMFVVGNISLPGGPRQTFYREEGQRSTIGKES